MKNKLLTAGLAAALGLTVGAAQAQPISLPGGTPLFIKFQDLEQIDATGGNGIAAPATQSANAPVGLPNSEQSWGIIQVSLIQYGTVLSNHDVIGANNVPLPLYDIGATPNQSVVGMFYGITQAGGTCNGNLCGAGGYLDLYWLDGPFNINDGMHTPAQRTGKDQYNGINVNLPAGTTSTFLARLDFASGVDSSTSTDIIGFGNPQVGGTAVAYFNVDTTTPTVGVGGIPGPPATGPWTNPFNGNWFYPSFGTGILDPTQPRDLRYNNTFNRLNQSPLNVWNGDTTGCGIHPVPSCIIGAQSNDPVQAFTTTPEPASLALMGIGLLGLALRERRKAA